MANNGLKISEMLYSSLEDAVNDDAQVPVSVDINGVKANRRVPIQLIKGYQGESIQGSQGYQGNQGNQGESIQGSQGYQGHQGTSGSGSTGNQNRIAFYDASGNLTDSENLIYHSVNQNIIIGNRNTFYESDTYGSTIIGERNTLTDKADASNIIGNLNNVSVTESIAIGLSNTLGGSNNAIAYALGRLNEVNAPEGMGIGFRNKVGLNSAGVTIGIGASNVVDGSEITVVGRANNITGADSTVIGNQINGNSLSMVVAVGRDIHGSQGLSDVVIIGNHLNTDAINNSTYVAIGSTDRPITFFGKYIDQFNNFGAQGKVLGFTPDGSISVVDSTSGPQGSSGDIQYNNSGAFDVSGQVYTNTYDNTYNPNFKINRLSWKTPAADPKSIGISRISFLNAASFILYNSSVTIELCNGDLCNRKIYATFSASDSVIRRLHATYDVLRVNVDNNLGDIEIDNSVVVLTGSTVTAVTLVANSLETSIDYLNANFIMKIVNHSAATVTFKTFTIAINETCDILYNGNNGNSNPTYTLLARYSNV